jgi:hypothetical protein
MNINPPNGKIEEAADTIVEAYWGHRDISKFAGEIAAKASAYKWEWQSRIFTERIKAKLK